MLVILVSSLLFLYISISAGLLVSKKLEISGTSTDIIFTGIVFINSLVTLLSILIPINFYLFVFLFFFSLLFTTRNKLFFYDFCKQIIKFESKVFFIFILLFALYYSSSAPEIFDTNFYHIQSIKWIEEYKLIPGLANIHGRFGFNSNVFTLFALTSFKPLFNQEILIVNYLTFLILIKHFINKLFEIFKKESITNKFLVYFISIVLLFFNLSSLPSASPDFLSFVITYYILIRTFELSYLSGKIDSKSFLPIIILSFYVLTVKLSTLPVVLLPLLFLYKYSFTTKDLIKISFILSLIIIPWLVRNIILTGWLIYPFHHLDLFNFEWEVPKFLVEIESQTIVGWARLENHDLLLDTARMNFSEWFPLWFSNLSKSRILILAFCFIFPLSFFSYYYRIRKNFILSSLIFTISFGLLFWLFMAPDFRFGKAFIYTSFISPFFFIPFSLRFSPSILVSKIVLFCFCFIFCFKSLYNSIPFKNKEFNGIIMPLVTTKPKDILFLAYKVKNNIFYYPNSGVQCFDQMLPCVPYLNRNFTLRGDKLQDGFKYIK